MAMTRDVFSALQRGAILGALGNIFKTRPKVPKSMDIFTREQRSRLMSRIRGRDTGPELLIRSMLHRLGYRFRLHRKDLTGTPDIVFPSRRSVVFVNGCFWHGHRCPRGRLPSSNVVFWEQKIGKNKRRDHRACKQLREEGWKVLTVWGCQTKNQDRLLKKLVRFLERTQPRMQG
jgi:DNA mismatch endonuclease (patch repair protein)